MKFDLVNCILTDTEIKELQALCAKTVSDILADIDDYDTLKAAKEWLRQCLTQLYDMRRYRNLEDDYTFSENTKFYFNHVKYDKRFRFQSEFYVTTAHRVSARLLEFDGVDDESTYALVRMGKAISDGLQGWYDSGRKIPKNQWSEEDFEMDWYLWYIMTKLKNSPIQRDIPLSSSTRIVKPILMTNSIISYMRQVLNACALCATIEEFWGPDADEALYDDNLIAMAEIRCRGNLCRLLPGLIDEINLITTMYEGGVRL